MPSLPLRAAGLLAALSSAFAAAPSGVFVLSAANLAATRDRLAQDDPALVPALARLRADANRALSTKPVSVMDKTRTPPSGDKHDYLSQAPYWWPDPAKPDGLPYVRRDGERNPEIDRGTDRGAMDRMFDAVNSLALAYYFTRHEPYAAHAALLLRVWFLDAATRMNPHLEFAQAIPGVTPGRGIGIIETAHLGELCDSVALLAASPAWSDTDARAFRTWLTAYFAWLTTSQHGRDEAKEKNNHGTWYAVQSAHLALALGRIDPARQTVADALRIRLARQVEPDGRQPLELSRTRSLNYSVFNLEGLIALATLGEHVGVDGWQFSTPDGRSLRAALAYVAAYLDPAKTWPHQEITQPDRSRIAPLLAAYLARRKDERWRALLDQFGGMPEQRAARWRLLFPLRS